MQFRTASIFLLVACLGCPSEQEPPDSQDLVVRTASYSCVDDGEVTWSFDLGITGDADSDATRVYVETADSPNASGYALAEVGRNDPDVEFSGEVAGTPDGQTPQPGEVPFSCAALDEVDVRFCASDFGAAEESCWQCGDGSAGEPPQGVQAWVDCAVQ